MKNVNSSERTIDPSLGIIDLPPLPDISQGNADFRDSSFFQTHESLPPPNEVLMLSHPTGKRCADAHRIVKFKDLNLVVKYGPAPSVQLEEAQIMIAVRKAFPNGEVPVPEVFGVRRHGDMNFVYMALMPGVALHKLKRAEVDKVMDRVKASVKLNEVEVALRRIRQDPSRPIAGSIIGSERHRQNVQLPREKNSKCVWTFAFAHNEDELHETDTLFCRSGRMPVITAVLN
ncbi:hypothetical protein B0T21DRAFT_414543 [Apiosordaria backusii]|uniref:Aminoglycoside phosphotransferase domain-containing protein n=1 Tax=Apiosordaria backusii TaxID=314023 RepID=A0AA40E3M1_9PEZI|nr:hypothetical protein B0T21DRAFT_414543 [Apiosordaria backusii]